MINFQFASSVSNKIANNIIRDGGGRSHSKRKRLAFRLQTWYSSFRHSIGQNDNGYIILPTSASHQHQRAGYILVVCDGMYYVCEIGRCIEAAC